MIVSATCHGRVDCAGRFLLFMFLLLLAGRTACCAAEKSQSKMEDFASIESISNGVPVYSFNNVMYVYGQSPDLYLGLIDLLTPLRLGFVHATYSNPSPHCPCADLPSA